MTYEVETRAVTSRPLAVARGRVTVDDIGDKIGALLSEVYEFLKHSAVKQSGHNVVLYWDEEDRELIATDTGVPIGVGVQVDAPFTNEGPVVCSATPAGIVATLVHRGPYQALPAAHAAVRWWCSAEVRRRSDSDND